MRRALAALALVLGTVGLAGCGDEDTPADAGSDEPTKTIDVTVEGSDITPNGDRVQVAVGQKIEFVVKSDAEGEIHVHSDPEHEYEYGAGTTTLPAFTIDRPGIVEVESHELDKTIVQLEVE
jgi:plastocyanin